MKILRKIQEKMAVIKPLERTLFNILLEKSPTDIRDCLQKQISQFNLVQRHSKLKEINFYCIKNGKPFLNLNDRIAYFLSDEVELLRLELLVGGALKLKARFIVVNGFLFSIVFDKSPNKFLYSDQIIITSSQFNTNFQAQKNHDVNNSTRLLPQDYLVLIKDTPKLEDYKTQLQLNIYGLNQIREVVLSDNNYYIIAERASLGVLAISESFPEDNNYYYFDYVDDKKVVLGNSLEVALNKLKIVFKV